MTDKDDFRWEVGDVVAKKDEHAVEMRVGGVTVEDETQSDGYLIRRRLYDVDDEKKMYQARNLDTGSVTLAAYLEGQQYEKIDEQEVRR